MNSLWYGLAMVAILVVVYWYIVNDKPLNSETHGVLAMKRPGKAEAIRKWRRKKFSLGPRP